MSIKDDSRAVANDERGRGAFTLIEMLVVIAIIGILAGLTLVVIPKVVDTRDRKSMDAFVNMVDTGIQRFYADFNSYPQSNTNLYFQGNYTEDSVTNNLFYELTGTYQDIFGNYFSQFDPNTAMGTNYLSKRLGYSAIIHSTNSTVASDSPHTFLTELKQANYGPVPLILPGPGEPSHVILFNTGIRANPNSKSTNAFLRYDSTSTNRHNMKSYDLWVTWTNSSKPVIVGNF